MKLNIITLILFGTCIAPINDKKTSLEALENLVIEAKAWQRRGEEILARAEVAIVHVNQHLEKQHLEAEVSDSEYSETAIKLTSTLEAILQRTSSGFSTNPDTSSGVQATVIRFERSDQIEILRNVDEVKTLINDLLSGTKTFLPSGLIIEGPFESLEIRVDGAICHLHNFLHSMTYERISTMDMTRTVDIELDGQWLNAYTRAS